MSPRITLKGYKNAEPILSGNEDNLSGAVASYQAYRWKMYHDAIAAEFPELNLMATTRANQPVSPVPDFSAFQRVG